MATQPQQPQQPPTPHVTRHDIPETLVDQLITVHFDGLMFRAELAVVRPEFHATPPAPPVVKTVTACRLMFSPKFAADLAQNLNTLVAQLQQQQQAQQGKKAN